jgi:ATP citrate (pro-S)-lyase
MCMLQACTPACCACCNRVRASAHAGCAGAQAEIEQIVQIGYLNGLFVLARAIGLIGHALDQKRLQQGLYRHPWEAVLYI